MNLSIQKIQTLSAHIKIKYRIFTNDNASIHLFRIMVIIFYVMLNPSFSNGQKLGIKERIIEPDHVLHSKSLDRDFQLYISFPKNYNPEDSVSYPVLYLMDGKLNFPLFHAIKNSLDFSGEIENIFIVGIGSEHNLASWIVNRVHDYTPTKDTIHDESMEKNIGFPTGTLQSGNAAKFLNTLKTEIIPFIDHHYNTNQERGISGHSLGGLFTTYCLIHARDLFSKIAINSPSLWWNNENLLRQIESQMKEESMPDNPAKVFISVGALEGSAMVPSMVKLSTILNESSDHKLDITWKIFDNETHQSVIAANLCRTLRVLYGPS